MEILHWIGFQRAQISISTRRERVPNAAHRKGRATEMMIHFAYSQGDASHPLEYFDRAFRNKTLKLKVLETKSIIFKKA